MRRSRGALALAAWVGLWSGALHAQARVDPELERLIGSLRAIDDHAHPNRCVAAGEPADDESDQIPADAFPAWQLPPLLDPTQPALRDAWAALYGVAPDASEATVLEAKRRVQREKGDGYGAWVLERAGIDVMLANRIALGRCLAAPHFRWVSFADAFLFPLDNAALHRENPDTDVSIRGAENLLRRYLREAQLEALPRDLAGYLARVVTPTLERQRKAGALAVKFEAAYIRPLAFENVPEADARAIYAKWIGGGEPPAADYRRLQDFLFHTVARESGRLGLAVHIHVLGVGAGAFYQGARAVPWLLEPVFNEPGLRGTRFVMIHGGWPESDAVGALLLKPNVYTDFSGITFVLPPHALARVIRSWLELAPEKVLFATDTFAVTETEGWEELTWLEARSARRALGLALTGMLRDGEIDRPRAEQLARMVMRENAEKLYGLGAPGSEG